MGKTWQNSNAIKNYFPLRNEIYRLGLSPAEVSIYGYLLSVEARKTYQCYPSYTTIGEAVGMSKKTVAKYVADLDVDTVDIGVPVLSMHAPFEVVSKTDVYMTYLAFRAFARD